MPEYQPDEFCNIALINEKVPYNYNLLRLYDFLIPLDLYDDQKRQVVIAEKTGIHGVKPTPAHVRQ